MDNFSFLGTFTSCYCWGLQVDISLCKSDLKFVTPFQGINLNQSSQSMDGEVNTKCELYKGRVLYLEVRIRNLVYSAKCLEMLYL